MTDAVSDIPVKSKKPFYILTGLCVVGCAIFKLSFIFMFIGMLPAMLAYVVDHDKNKYVFSTIAALNLAGVFPEMMDIYMQGNTLDGVKDKLFDVTVWLTMYSAAGMGWAIVWVSPPLAGMVMEGLYRGRILHMEALQKKLEEEWGPEIAGRTKKE